MEFLKVAEAFLRTHSSFIYLLAIASMIISSFSLFKNHWKIFNDTYKKYFNVDFSLRGENEKIISKSSYFLKVLAFEMEVIELSIKFLSNDRFQPFRKYIEQIKTKAQKQELLEVRKPTSPSIVGLFAISKSNNNLFSSIFLLIGLIVYEIIMYISNYSLINLVSVFLIFLIIAVAIDEYALSYRVKNGSFGTNKEEAKEIIKFILKNANKHDNFNGPNGDKIKVFNEVRQQDTEARDIYVGGLNPSGI